jgi:hypothetical protein
VQHGDGQVGTVVVLPEERGFERAHREGAWAHGTQRTVNTEMYGYIGCGPFTIS